MKLSGDANDCMHGQSSNSHHHHHHHHLSSIPVRFNRFSPTSLNKTEEHSTTGMILVGQRSIRTIVSCCTRQTRAISPFPSSLTDTHMFASNESISISCRHQLGASLLQSQKRKHITRCAQHFHRAKDQYL